MSDSRKNRRSREGICECCGSRSLLRPNRRPQVPLLTDDELLELIDRKGEEEADAYHAVMSQLIDTNECATCRSLPSSQYFEVITGKGISLIGICGLIPAYC